MFSDRYNGQSRIRWREPEKEKFLAFFLKKGQQSLEIIYEVTDEKIFEVKELAIQISSENTFDRTASRETLK